VRQLLQAKDNSGEDFITLTGSSGCVWGAVTDFTHLLLLTQHKNFISE